MEIAIKSSIFPVFLTLWHNIPPHFWHRLKDSTQMFAPHKHFMWRITERERETIYARKEVESVEKFLYVKIARIIFWGAFWAERDAPSAEARVVQIRTSTLISYDDEPQADSWSSLSYLSGATNLSLISSCPRQSHFCVQFAIARFFSIFLRELFFRVIG